MANCAKCGAALAPGATFCGSCGSQVSAAAAPAGTVAGTPAPAASSGLSQNVAGMLAYLFIIGPILMMVLEPYSKDKFVRFHAFQSLFFDIGCTVLWIPVFIVGLIPYIGSLISFLVFLSVVALWVIIVVKAYGGQKFQLPFIGKLAEEQANK